MSKITKEKIIENAKKFNFSDNAIKVLLARTLQKDKQGNVKETIEQAYERTAKVLAEPDKLFGASTKEVKRTEKKFFEVMSNKEFFSNRCINNAGRKYPHQQLAACYVLPIKDDLEYIYDILYKAAFIQKWDGAAGIDYSVLRPKGDLVGSTGGKSSGPISFMKLFNYSSVIISDGGLRRGANMAVLRVDHPDIEEFIKCKQNTDQLDLFNISVAVTDEFMNSLKKDKEYWLINPRTKVNVKKISAKYIFDLIAQNAHKTGDPGLVFIDEINRTNPTPYIGEITAVNLCGEQPLLPFESCNLGNIILPSMTKVTSRGTEIDWDKIEKTVYTGVHFLDNTIEANNYLFKEIEDIVKNGNRKIGLGIMGFADLLIMLNIPYNSKEGLDIGEKIMKYINDKSHEASSELAKKRGNFKNFKNSLWDQRGYKYMRNATTTTVAPTGTLSVMLDCSPGIEPVYAFAYTRWGLKSSEKKENFYYFDNKLEKILKDKWLYSKELINKIVKTGSIQNIKEIPDEIKKVYVNSYDITPKWHIKMQSAFQKHVDSAITKTVNMSSTSSVEDVKESYILAYEYKCKGITIYRDKSKSEQVMSIGKK